MSVTEKKSSLNRKFQSLTSSRQNSYFCGGKKSNSKGLQWGREWGILEPSPNGNWKNLEVMNECQISPLYKIQYCPWRLVICLHKAYSSRPQSCIFFNILICRAYKFPSSTALIVNPSLLPAYPLLLMSRAGPLGAPPRPLGTCKQQGEQLCPPALKQHPSLRFVL